MILVTRLSPEECATRLKESVDSEFVFFGSKEAVGRVGRNSARLMWRANRRSPMETVLWLSWASSETGTRISCRTGISKFALAFSTLWIGLFVVLAAVAAFERLGSDGSTADLSWLGPLPALGIGVLVFGVWRWMARDNEKNLIGFLRRTLEAKEVTAPSALVT